MVFLLLKWCLLLVICKYSWLLKKMFFRINKFNWNSMMRFFSVVIIILLFLKNCCVIRRFSSLWLVVKSSLIRFCCLMKWSWKLRLMNCVRSCLRMLKRLMFFVVFVSVVSVVFLICYCVSVLNWFLVMKRKLVLLRFFLLRWKKSLNIFWFNWKCWSIGRKRWCLSRMVKNGLLWLFG